MIVQRTSSVSGVATRHRPGWSPHSFLGETRFQTVHSCSLSKKHCRFVTFRHAHTGPRWWGYFSRPSGLARGARGSRFRYALVFGQPSVGTSQQRKGKRDFRDTQRETDKSSKRKTRGLVVCVCFRKPSRGMSPTRPQSRVWPGDDSVYRWARWRWWGVVMDARA